MKNYNLASFICEEGEGCYVSYIKKSDQWYSYRDKGLDGIKEILNIAEAKKRACILHYVRGLPSGL